MPFNINGTIVSNTLIKLYNNENVVRSGLALYLDAGISNSYPGSGTTWTDQSNSINATLTNGPTFNTVSGSIIFLDGTNDYISIPGSTTVYTSNFTWQSFHYIRIGNGSDLDGMWWSESGGKNFLTGYRNTNQSNPYFRIDTPTSVYQSPSAGTQSNGLGVNAGAVSGRWLFTTIVKSGTTFYLYWDAAVLMWTVTISDWSINDTSRAIAFGARNDGSFATSMNIGNILMYNRALSTGEIIQNYNSFRRRFGV